ncbi:50S ribosomal protein L30e [archaeon]
MEDTEVIKRVVENGEVRIGSRSVSKELNKGKPKLVVLSSNCPKPIREDIEGKAKAANTPVYGYTGTSLELGEVCRKPFPISAMAVVSPGDASLTQLIKGGKA